MTCEFIWRRHSNTTRLYIRCVVTLATHSHTKFITFAKVNRVGRRRWCWWWKKRERERNGTKPRNETNKIMARKKLCVNGFRFKWNQKCSNGSTVGSDDEKKRMGGARTTMTRRHSKRSDKCIHVYGVDLCSCVRRRRRRRRRQHIRDTQHRFLNYFICYLFEGLNFMSFCLYVKSFCHQEITYHTRHNRKRKRRTQSEDKPVFYGCAA